MTATACAHASVWENRRDPDGYIWGRCQDCGAYGAFPPPRQERLKKMDEEKKTQAQEHIEQFFAWSHLPLHLQDASRPFGELAQHILATVPRNPERTVALRKLLEAKDAAVRAVLAK